MNEVGAKKHLIEKIWWAIPPVFLVCVYWPLLMLILDGKYSLSGWFSDLKSITIGDSTLYGTFMFGFMMLGYILTINRSLKVRVIVPSILGIIGLWVGFLIALVISESP